jgi:hypothetical protein
MADTSSLSRTRDKRARKLTAKVSAGLSQSKRLKKNTSTSPLKTQLILIPETGQDQGSKDKSTADTRATEEQHSHASTANVVYLLGDPTSWWALGSPRLLATDTPEHLQSVIVKNIGAGVDMNRFLVPTRIVFEQISPAEREEYKKEGLHISKIPHSWKKWSAMEHGQKNQIHLCYLCIICFACIMYRLRRDF